MYNWCMKKCFIIQNVQDVQADSNVINFLISWYIKDIWKSS